MIIYTLQLTTNNQQPAIINQKTKSKNLKLKDKETIGLFDTVREGQ